MSFTDFDFPHTHFYESDLRELLRIVKTLMVKLDELEEWKSEHESEYQELKELYDAIISGNFPPNIIQAFENWMYNNAIDLVGKLVKHVYFGLTNDGYFCAYIPENWSDITFDTINDFDSPLYGHLMLIYD